MTRAEFLALLRQERGQDEESLHREQLLLQRMLEDDDYAPRSTTQAAGERASEYLQAGARVLEDERRHGTIKPPTSPIGARVGEFLSDVAQANRGSVNEFLLPGEGTAGWLSKAAYGETPGWMDRLGAAVDLADVTPFGAAAGVARSGARTVAREGASRARNRVRTTGQYVGAPSGVDSPQALGRMRSDYIEQVEAGIPGRDWYHDTSKWIDTVAPEGKRQAIADTIGVTSQGASVDGNLGFTVRAANQKAAGEPVSTGRFPGNQSPLIEQAFAGDRSHLGPKRQPFADNVSVEWNPERAQHPVHDIWEGRAFGYRHPDGSQWDAGFSPQQHAFMDEQTAAINEKMNRDQLGGFDNWDPLRTQAAAWTGAKIRAGSLSPEDAAQHYGDFSAKYQAAATYEQTPGAGAGHMESLLGEPFSVRQRYDNAARWEDARGRDSIYSEGGLLTEPTTEAVGAYTPQGTGVLETNPARVARPLVTTDAGAVRALDSSLLDAGESARAYIDVQNGGAWHKIVPDSQTKAGDRTGVLIDAPSPSEDQMRALNDLVEPMGMFAVDSGQGIRLLNAPWTDAGGARTGASLNKELKGRLGQGLRELFGDVGIARAKIESNYIDYEELWQKGGGAATRKFLDDIEAMPAFAESVEPALKRKAQANMDRDDLFSGAAREDIKTARQILVSEGLSGLRKALDSGVILPAAAFALIAPEMIEPAAPGD